MHKYEKLRNESTLMSAGSQEFNQTHAATFERKGRPSQFLPVQWLDWNHWTHPETPSATFSNSRRRLLKHSSCVGSELWIALYCAQEASEAPKVRDHTSHKVREGRMIYPDTIYNNARKKYGEKERKES